jgi:hypothetical protein
VTPFELSLQHDLDVERQRFDSDWLFKWYGMTYAGGKTDVEDFKGGRISYGGILFEGSPPLVFWSAVERYLVQQVHKAFQRWEKETVTYAEPVRRASLERTAGLVRAFVATVVQKAIKTDQALRGRGTPKTDLPHGSSGAQTGANAAVHKLTKAHMELLPSDKPEERQTLRRRIGEALNLKPGLWGITIDLKKLFERTKK